MEASNREKRSAVLRVAAFSAAVWISFAVFSAWSNNFDFSHFINIGEKFADSTLPANLAVIKKAGGYDGQFYYRLAIDPFTSEKTAHGITLDNPALRHQRILYPLLVWALSLGGRFFVPELLFLVNLACLVFTGWVGARIASDYGLDPATGLIFTFFPGFIFSLRSGLTEPLAAALLLTYLFLYMRNKTGAANAALALAVLARESALIVAIGKTAELLFFCLVRREDRKRELASSLIPFVPFALLQGVLFLTWREIPLLQSGAANVTAPFTGFLRYIHWLFLHAVDVESFSDFLEPAGILAMILAACWTTIRNRAKQPSHLVWLLAYSMLLFSLDTAWNQTFLRVFTDVFILSAFIVISDRRGAIIKILLPLTFIWFMLEIYDYTIIDIHLRTSYSAWKF